MPRCDCHQPLPSARNPASLLIMHGPSLPQPDAQRFPMRRHVMLWTKVKPWRRIGTLPPTRSIWVSAGARRWAESTGGAGNFASLSFSVEDSLTWAVMRIPSSLFAHPCRGRFPFLYFLFFFSDSGGEERGERVSVRPESKRERQEPQVYGNVETAGELCHQTTLLHLSTCEAWLERLLGAGSDARAPCAPWAGWGGVEPGMEG